MPRTPEPELPADVATLHAMVRELRAAQAMVAVPEPAAIAEQPESISVSAIARVCHEVNRAYCAGLGDDTQVAWDDAADWQRESAIKGVHFAISNPEAQPSAQHDAWLNDKLEDGWKYGPVKDAEAKEHPCILPYDELPAEQRTKDYLFLAVVRSMVLA